jgi:hypothetical protein
VFAVLKKSGQPIKTSRIVRVLGMRSLEIDDIKLNEINSCSYAVVAMREGSACLFATGLMLFDKMKWGKS